MSMAIIIDIPEQKRRLYNFPLDQEELTDSDVDAARTEANYPTDWYQAEMDGWQVSVLSAPVHPKTVAKCDVVDWTGGVPV